MRASQQLPDLLSGWPTFHLRSWTLLRRLYCQGYLTHNFLVLCVFLPSTCFGTISCASTFHFFSFHWSYFKVALSSLFQLTACVCSIHRDSIKTFHNLWETFPDENCMLTNRELLAEVIRNNLLLPLTRLFIQWNKKRFCVKLSPFYMMSIIINHI